MNPGDVVKVLRGDHANHPGVILDVNAGRLGVACSTGTERSGLRSYVVRAGTRYASRMGLEKDSYFYERAIEWASPAAFERWLTRHGQPGTTPNEVMIELRKLHGLR